MRVLFAIAHVDKGGGQAIQSRQLVERLSRRVDGEFLALSSTGNSAETLGADVRIVGRLRFPGGILDLKRAIAARRKEVDLVQALDSYYALPGARLARAHPLVLRSGAHPIEDLGSRYGALGRMAMRSVNPWLLSGTTVVVNAEHLRAPYGPRNVVCIPNGVDTARFRAAPDREAARATLGLPSDRPVIAFTGKIIPRKNVEDLYWLAREIPSAHLLLAGNDREPYYGDRYHRTVREAFPDVLPRVHLTGEVAAERIPTVLAAADLFVFPSRLEGMPNSVLEAMAAALPVVASDSPAHRELLADGIGRLYRTREELAETVRQLLAEPETARAVGARARGVVEQTHSLDAAADRYLSLYSALLGESDRVPGVASP